MKILYIGQHTLGTTSKMRADQLKEILNPKCFEIVDTHTPFFKTPRVFRSIGFRYKMGPLITNTNLYIIKKLDALSDKTFDLIWVDKAVYITNQTTLLLRKKTKKLVHFTPDMAFYGNQSIHFNKSLPIYDFVISTKTQEAHYYKQLVNPNTFILTTQGFDSFIHKPSYAFVQKENKVAFVGLAEPARIKTIKNLLDAGIDVKLAGKGWRRFVKNNKNNKHLEFICETLINEEYASFISSSLFSIGMLSKKFPELHTTRTFEIPACATALVTECNSETSSFFTEEEVIFYDSIEEMISKIKYYQSNPKMLEILINKGRKRVIDDGKDYRTIVESILQKIGFGE